MRVCPKCQSVHRDSQEFCPDDGSELEALGEEFEVAATAYGPVDIHDTSGDLDDTIGQEPPKRGSVAPDEILEQQKGNDLVGQTIGGVYTVIEQIGVGGMGEVYRVKHLNLKKEYALKVLTKVAQNHPEAIERFKQEAISASHIEHDNIVDIITLDSTDEGHLYIVMELLRGQSLADALKQSAPLSIERALTITYQICRSVHAAHEEGIIHRDLKPENVFLTRKGEAEFVKILDFGISKIHDAESDRVRITKTGQFLGTPLYMSPEQAKGDPDPDRRIDIYSLGVILYEMLEGKTPFTGENYFQLIWKHSNEEAPEMEAEIPERLSRAIMRALSKEARHRFPTMLDFEEAIIEAVPETPPPAFLLDYRPSLQSRAPTPSLAPPKPKGSTGWLIAAGLGGALAVALVFGLNAGDDGDEERAGSTNPAVPDAEVVISSSLADDGGAAHADSSVNGDAEAAVEQPPTVMLSVRTRPAGAVVFLGEDRLGETPLEVERASGTDELVLRIVKPGYVAAKRRITLEDALSLELVLTKRRKIPPPGGDPGLPYKTKL